MLPSLSAMRHGSAVRRSSKKLRASHSGRCLLLLLVLGLVSFAPRRWHSDAKSGQGDLGAFGTFVPSKIDRLGSSNPKPNLRGRATAGDQENTAILDRPVVNGRRTQPTGNDGPEKMPRIEREVSRALELEEQDILRPVPERLEASSSQSFGSVAAAVCAALLVGLAAGFALRPEKIDRDRLPSEPQALPVQVQGPDSDSQSSPGVVLEKATGKIQSVAGGMRDVATKVDKAVARLKEAESKEDQLLRYDDKLAKMYTGLMESARDAGAKLQDVASSIAPAPPTEKGPASRVSASVVKKIRDIGDMLDEAQADVYKEEWLTLKVYPSVFRAFLPLMEYYEKEAFSDGVGDKFVNAATRDSLSFYRMQMSVSIDRLAKAIENQKVREVEEAFAKTSLSYDRFLKAGDLYQGYDPVTSTTVFFKNISDDQLRYTPLALQQPQIRDEVLVLQGPDKGKVGRIIWLGRENGDDLDSKVLSAVVKLEPNPVLGSSKSGGVREVKAYPYKWLVMTRGSNESYMQDLVLATLAAMVSCTVTYPLETVKARVQSNLPLIPPEGPQALFRGVELNVLREAPNAGFLMAGFNYFTRFAVGLPFVNGNDPNLKFLLMIPSGVVAMLTGAFVKAPVIDISKQVQAGVAQNAGEAIQNVYLKPSPSQVSKRLARTLMLTGIRGVPFGAFQCFIYEVLKDQTPPLLESIGVPIWAEPFLWGGIAGFCTGYLTNPPDVVMQRLALESDDDKDDKPFSIGETWEQIVRATQKVYEEDGPAGFAKGGLENAIYFLPEAMVWFGVYEALKGVANSVGQAI